MMIREGVKLNETQLAEILFDEIIYSLNKINRTINDKFKFDQVVRTEYLIKDFDFQKLFEILKTKREGIYNVYDYFENGYKHLMFDFDKL